MPTNLHALIRYRTIDHCLHRPGKQWNRERLAQACGDALRYYDKEAIDNPSIRTIQHDINTMKFGKLGYYAPIRYDRRRQSYCYTDPGFSISNSPLNVDDVNELNHALTILRQFSGFRHVEGIENIIAKLEYTLSLRGSRAKDAIQFGHQIEAPGQQWLDMLYRSIQEERSLELDYQPFYYDAPFTTWVSPYLLREYNNRWYLMCYDFNKSAVRSYALDRMLRISPSERQYYIDRSFNGNTYHNHIIGITLPPDGVIQDIHLRFIAEQVPYVKTKPLHSSQEIIEDTPRHTTFAYRLIPNYEMESLILSFGERVEVLRPEGLREKMRERAAALSGLYA